MATVDVYIHPIGYSACNAACTNAVVAKLVVLLPNDWVVAVDVVSAALLMAVLLIVTLVKYPPKILTSSSLCVPSVPTTDAMFDAHSTLANCSGDK